jgi:hypothetical protein
VADNPHYLADFRFSRLDLDGDAGFFSCGKGMLMIEGKHDIQRGKWIEPAFPKSGWYCSSMADAGRDGRICEMCGVAEVQWLHMMAHGERPGLLAVGLDCAQDLGRDFERARRRGIAFSFECRVRAAWQKQEWELSKDGNYYTNARGYNFSTFLFGDGRFGLRVRLKHTVDDKDKIDGTNKYATLQDAMKAWPDALFHARSRLTDGKTFDNWRSLCGPTA